MGCSCQDQKRDSSQAINASFDLHSHFPALSALLGPAARLVHRQEMAVVYLAHFDVLDHLVVHMSQEALLFLQEPFKLPGVDLLPAPCRLSQQSQLGPDPFLEDLEPVLAELEIEL